MPEMPLNTFKYNLYDLHLRTANQMCLLVYKYNKENETYTGVTFDSTEIIESSSFDKRFFPDSIRYDQLANELRDKLNEVLNRINDSTLTSKITNKVINDTVQITNFIININNRFIFDVQDIKTIENRNIEYLSNLMQGFVYTKIVTKNSADYCLLTYDDFNRIVSVYENTSRI